MAVSRFARIAAGCTVLFFFLSSAAANAVRAQQDTIEIPGEAVAKKTLDNGLTILAKTSTPKGLVAIDVKILAGSSLEGEYMGSGISHLVEHMVFKGTKTRGVGSIEREVKSYGGIINGSTSDDITDYRLLIPSENMPNGLALLKDMLLNAVFDSNELAKEKEVVLSEININEDDPESRLMKRLDETAYLRHPYKNPPIGYPGRLKAIVREDLIKYYNRMYVPNRMVITIVGGVDRSDAIAKAEAEFMDFREPDYKPILPPDAEPPQMDTRRLEEDSKVNLAYIAMGFHSTGILDEDLFAMDVLAMILGRGDSSRLNTALVKDGRLAYSVSAWNRTPKDPGLFTITSILDKANIDKVEAAVLDEISRLRDNYVSDDELASARRMAVADFIASLETVDAQANDIGLSYILTGSPEFSRRYVHGVQSVSRDDVKRVVNKYMGNRNLTVVRLEPGYKVPDLPAGETVAGSETTIKEVLPNGLRVLLRRDPKTPTVSITAAMLGGIMAEDASNNGISNLTAQMMLKGTRSRSERQIKGHIESLGGTIAPFSGLSAFGVKIDVLKTDVRTALDTLEDILAHSEFPPEEFGKEIDLTLAAVQEENDDIFATGFSALRKTVFQNSPYGLRYIGEASTVRSLKPEDLKSFYVKYVAPDNMVLSISGDIDLEHTLAMIRSGFSGLAPKKTSIPGPEGPRLTKKEIRSIFMDREQSLVLLGFETVSINEPDRYALEVLGSIMSGYSGRLFEEIRNRRALAYTLGCAQKLGIGRGYFIFYVATTNDLLAEARRSLTDEIDRLRQSGVTDAELALAKAELRVSRQVARQTNDFYSLNSALDELYGLGHDNIYRYETSIEKVSRDDVNAVARKYLDPDRRAEIIITQRI